VIPTVSLPMYNLPEMRADNARFWEALRELLVEAGLRDISERLTFDRLPVPERIGPEGSHVFVAGGPTVRIHLPPLPKMIFSNWYNILYLYYMVQPTSPPAPVL
jgi:hypothetical protein